MLDMDDGYFEIHSILSSTFFKKYIARFSYDTMEMFLLRLIIQTNTKKQFATGVYLCNQIRSLTL